MESKKDLYPYTDKVIVTETQQEATLLWRGFDLVVVSINGVQQSMTPEEVGVPRRGRPKTIR